MKPKVPKMKEPKVDPVATVESAPEAADAEALRQRRKSGFSKTILTGAMTPATGKKQTLG